MTTRPASPAPARAGHGHAHAACCGHDHAHHHHHAAHHAPVERSEDALIWARGVTLTRQGRHLLLDVAIQIRPGEIVTLIGPNGAGKTTLLKVLLGLERPDAGEVVRSAKLKIGYVPQRFDIDPTIPMTVARFLALSARTDGRKAAHALAEVGATRLETQQLGQLSGGELQRVLLARALLREPSLLVLDEPARGVDNVGEAELYTLIGRLRAEHGFSVLLVSHDLHVVMAQSDRVICLNKHVCCSGVPHTVAQHPEYVRLFGPEGARALAVYHHHHDHEHDLAGEPRDAHAHQHDPAPGRARKDGA